MAKQKAIFMYLGKFMTRDNKVAHQYAELSTEHEVINRDWTFNSKLFKKGAVGSMYDVEIDGTRVSYSKTAYPASYVKDGDTHVDSFLYFKWLGEYRERHRQTEARERYSKSGDNPVKSELEALRDVYKRLGTRERSQFIANVVFEITK